MRSYNPQKIQSAEISEIVKTYFETDRFEPDNFFVLKKELIDFFHKQKDWRRINRSLWLISVHCYWQNLWRISTEEVVENMVEQIPDAVRLGFDVFKNFIYYLSERFYRPEEMQEFYRKIREQIISSDIAMGLNDTEKKLSDIYKEIELLNSYEDDSMRATEFYDQLKRLLFRNSDDGLISQYIYADQAEAAQNLIKLLDFIHNTEPKFIWPAVESEVYYFNTGIKPESLPVPVQIGVPPKDLDEVLNIPEIKNLTAPSILPDEINQNKPVLDPSVTVEQLYDRFGVSRDIAEGEIDNTSASKTMNNQSADNKSSDLNNLTQLKTEEIMSDNNFTQAINNQPIAPTTISRPTYAEIRAKVDGAFSKDKKGEYKDLDAVLMALAKASEKYNDPKIAELYVFDENTGSFVWNI